MTREEKEVRNQEIVVLRNQGKSMTQIAEMYGLTLSAIHRICKRYGVAGVMSMRKATVQEYRNQYTNGLFDREANANKYVEKIVGYEYAGNFTGIDGFVDIRCKACGHIQKKSMISIRHGRQPSCPVCLANAKAEKKAEQEAERDQKRLNRYLTQKFTQMSFVVCGCCGNVFVTANSRRKYCSKECLAKVTNSVTKDKRIKKMRAVVVDRGISLERLYQRDEGKCYICGRTCDWNDYYINKNGAFIAGQNYPSIDHVTPLSKGGKHEWLNVKLACRKCNWEKSDSMSSLYA